MLMLMLMLMHMHMHMHMHIPATLGICWPHSICHAHNTRKLATCRY
jgi:hypothetical protein